MIAVRDYMCSHGQERARAEKLMNDCCMLMNNDDCTFLKFCIRVSRTTITHDKAHVHATSPFASLPAAELGQSVQTSLFLQERGCSPPPGMGAVVMKCRRRCSLSAGGCACRRLPLLRLPLSEACCCCRSFPCRSALISSQMASKSELSRRVGDALRHPVKRLPQRVVPALVVLPHPKALDHRPACAHDPTLLLLFSAASLHTTIPSESAYRS